MFPKTLLDFEHWFRSEEACRAYLARIRWPKGFVCPSCNHQQAWQIRRGKFRCGKCRRDTSVMAGTIFESSRMPLRLWFRAVWQVTHQKSGVSALGLQRTLGLGSYRTSWACLHKLRRAMIRPGRQPLTDTVEVDETFIGGPGKNRKQAGRHVGGKSLVIIAAEVRGDGIGRIRLQAIPDTSKEHLLAFIADAISPGATVITDGLPVYGNLTKLGYTHRPRIVEISRDAAPKLLPRVHRVAALLKRWILGVHHGSFSKHQVDYYLEEFAFRFNRRTSSSRGQLFYRLVQQALAVDSVPVSSIEKGA